MAMASVTALYHRPGGASLPSKGDLRSSSCHHAQWCCRRAQLMPLVCSSDGGILNIQCPALATNATAASGSRNISIFQRNGAAHIWTQPARCVLVCSGLSASRHEGFPRRYYTLHILTHCNQHERCKLQFSCCLTLGKKRGLRH